MHGNRCGPPFLTQRCTAGVPWTACLTALPTIHEEPKIGGSLYTERRGESGDGRYNYGTDDYGVYGGIANGGQT